MPEFSCTNSMVPPCRADTLAASPPRVPPGKTLTLRRPSLLDATSSANLLAPISSGWPLGFCSANLKVRSWAWARPVASIRLAAPRAAHRARRAKRVMASLQCGWGREDRSVGEPACRDGHEGGEEDHEEHDGELGDHEGDDATGDLVHLNLADAGDDVEHGAHGRGDQADGVVDDEEHAEVDGVDAGGLDDRHQQ